MPSFLVPSVHGWSDVLPDSKSHSRQALQTKAAFIGQAQVPELQVWFPTHLVPQAPQFAVSVFLLTQLPQFELPAGQQMLAPVPE